MYVSLPGNATDAGGLYMGFIADMMRAKSATLAGPGYSSGRSDPGRLWRSPNDRQGGSWAASASSGDPAVIRLLQAQRSYAPNAWSDDRYEQTLRHFNGIQYVAIHSICKHLSRCEFMVYKEDPHHPDGKRPVTKYDPPEGERMVRPHDLVKLLKKPNRKDSFGKMMYRWGQQKRLTGSALTWMVPNKLGVPMELYCIPTAMAVPQATTNPQYPEGYYRIQPVYPYGPFSTFPTPNTSVGAPIPAQWILRFSYPHPLLYNEGYSPLTALRHQIDQFESIERSRWYSMKRSVKPSAVLNFGEMEGAEPLPDTEIERVRTEWENEFQGSENTGKLIIAPPGGTLEQWGATPSDMDYPQGWDQVASFILGGGFGITKQAAGMIEDSAYATLFATLKQLYWTTLEPECEEIAAELTARLAPFFGDDLIIEIRCKPIDDHEILFQKINIAIQGKAIKKNTLLRLLDMPTTSEKWGEEFAGDDHNALEQQKQQQEMMGQETPGAGGGMGSLIRQMTGGAGPPKQDPTVEQSRPDTGSGMEGALGPRKSLHNLRRLYRSKRVPIYTNGHAR